MAKKCPDCGELFGADAELCPYDGAPLEERSDDRDELVGHVVDDRFRLERLLGAGGMGRVYEATQLSVDRRVAVKLIRYRGGTDRSVRERFEREARVVSELSHPNIVRLIDFGRDDDREAPYIAMEFIDGLEVRSLLEDARLHPNLAVEIASQMAAALVEAHGADIVHRDLKTDNVLLVPVSSGGFQAKVIDFGIAFPRSSPERLTNTGMICGTPRYVSPEQARGSEVGPKSDLYSLGVVIFEMVTGRLPFRADSAFNVMMKHVQQQPPAIRSALAADQRPEGLSELVDDLLAKDPDRRPGGARIVRDRIQQVRESNDWEPIDLEGRRDLEEELTPWLKTTASVDPGDFDLEGGAGDGAPPFSAPEFDAPRDDRSDRPAAAAGEGAVPPDRTDDGEEQPDLVGVPGETGFGVERSRPNGSDEPPAEESSPGESAVSRPIRPRNALLVAGGLAVAGLALYWSATPRSPATEPREESQSAGSEPTATSSTSGRESTSGRTAADPKGDDESNRSSGVPSADVGSRRTRSERGTRPDAGGTGSAADPRATGDRKPEGHTDARPPARARGSDRAPEETRSARAKERDESAERAGSSASEPDTPANPPPESTSESDSPDGEEGSPSLNQKVYRQLDRAGSE